jgi:hypothetical protein
MWVLGMVSCCSHWKLLAKIIYLIIC